MALRLRRGTNQDRLNMTPEQGELIYVTDWEYNATTNTPKLGDGTSIGHNVAPLWVGDGATPGGHAAGAANLDDLTDVQISGLGGVSLGLGQALVYDGTLWRNSREYTANTGDQIIKHTRQSLQADNANQRTSLRLGRRVTDVTGSTGSLYNIGGEPLIGGPAIDFAIETATPNSESRFASIGASWDPSFGAKNTVTIAVSGDNFSSSQLLYSASPQGTNINNGVVYVDKTNNRMGINTTTPSYTLDVQGTAAITGAVTLGGAVSTGGNLTVGGNLIVNGSTTTVNSVTVTVDDKNIELGSVNSPTDTTADGGGITLKGTTDKTITWLVSNGGWNFSNGINITGGVHATNTITTTADSISMNTDNTSADSLLYFKSTTQYLKWNNTSNQFELSNGVSINGNALVSGTVSATGTISTTAESISMNTDSTATDSYLNFKGFTQYLKWNNTTSKFEISNDLYGVGSIIATQDLGTYGNNIYFNYDNASSADAALIVNRGTNPQVRFKWNDSLQRWLSTVDGTNYIAIPNQTLDTTTDVNFNSVTLNSIAKSAAYTYTTTSTTQFTLDSTTRTMIKALVSVTNTISGATHCVEILALRTGTTTAKITVYGELVSASVLATFSADVNSGSLRILATPASSQSTTFNVHRTAVN